jgi:hypothetical protein
MSRVKYTGRWRYLTIPSQKLAFQVGMEIDRLDKSDFKTLDRIVDEENDVVNGVKSMHPDNLLMYWLEKNGIPYRVLSEHLFNKKYGSEDWIIVNKSTR